MSDIEIDEEVEAVVEQDEDDGSCGTCGGSGGGDYPGIYCWDCGGRGYLRSAKYDNYDGPDEDLRGRYD